MSFEIEELAPCVRCGRERPVREFLRDSCGFGYCLECAPGDPLDEQPVLTLRIDEPDVVEILGRRYHLEFFRQLEDVTPDGQALRVVRNLRNQTSIERFDVQDFPRGDEFLG